MKNILHFSFVFVGTVIGAGFITGRELAEFFGIYFPYGYLGILICSIIFSLVVYGVLSICLDYDIKDYNRFSSLAFGKLHYFSKIIVFLFMFCLLSAMISCGGELITYIFGINTYLCKGIISVLIYFILYFNKKGVVLANSILTPLIISGCFLIGLKGDFGVINNNFSVKAFISPFVYVSYNVITLICVLVNMNYLIKDRKSALISSVTGGSLLGIIALFISLCLSNDNINSKFPVLEFTLKFGNFLPVVYFVVLFSAVITTALSNAYGIMEYKNKRGFIVIFSFFLSLMDFSYFVSRAYVLFGYIGLFQVIIILFYLFLKNIVEYRQKK